MKALKSDMGIALIMAAVAVILLTLAEHYQNMYLVLAAAALTLATYITYPPTWILSLLRVKSTDRKE